MLKSWYIYRSHFGGGKRHSDALYQGMLSQMPLGATQAYVSWLVSDTVSGSLPDLLRGIQVYTLLKGSLVNQAWLLPSPSPRTFMVDFHSRKW